MWIDITGLQNCPDAIALVDAATNVVQFLSYEGIFEATEGAAIGMTSTDMGVSEASTTSIGNTLQLAGSGTNYNDFVWGGASNVASHGNLNSFQYISSCPGDTDNDDLPNEWESLYFGGPTNATAYLDSDCDGLDNLSEYIAGTIPTSAVSCFTISAELSGTENQVAFQSVTNRAYNLYYRTSLTEGDWLIIQTNIPGNDDTIIISVTNELSPIFYRTRVVIP